MPTTRLIMARAKTNYGERASDEAEAKDIGTVEGSDHGLKLREGLRVEGKCSMTALIMVVGLSECPGQHGSNFLLHRITARFGLRAMEIELRLRVIRTLGAGG